MDLPTQKKKKNPQLPKHLYRESNKSKNDNSFLAGPDYLAQELKLKIGPSITSVP